MAAVGGPDCLLVRAAPRLGLKQDEGPSQELQELSAHLPRSQGGRGGLAGPGAQGTLGSPCFLGAPQDLRPPLSLEGLVFLVHLVGLGLLEFPDHPVGKKTN